MSDSQITALPVTVGLGAKEPQSHSRLSTNQSAWKKELETHIYKQRQQDDLGQSQEHKSSNNASGSLFLNGKPLVSEMKVDTARHVSHRFTEPSSSAAGQALSAGKVTDELFLNSNKLLNSFVSTALNFQKNSQVFSIKTNATPDASRSAKPEFNVPTYEVKPFNIKLLASGELLIRDYKQGLLHNTNIDDLVKEVKRILDRDIQKLRINGDLVWESEKAPSNNEHIIDLIY